MAHTKIDGVDYTPKGVRDLRDEVIAMRNKEFEGFPSSINTTVVLTHVIVLLSYLADLVADAERVDSLKFGEAAQDAAHYVFPAEWKTNNQLNLGE